MCAMVLSVLKSLVGDMEIMNTWTEGDKVFYEIEIDTILGETMAGIRARIGLAMDLPVRWSSIEEREKLTKGIIYKAWRVVVSMPRRLGGGDDEDDEED